MYRIRSQIFVGSILYILNVGVYAQIEQVETGDAGQCYDIDSNPEIYSTTQVIQNLRLLGLEPVTAHGATPSAPGDDTGPIQDAIFTAIEDCVNAQGLQADGDRNTNPQGVPTGAARDIYIDSCRAVFFPPGEYRVSDTIRVMQPLKPKSGTLNLFLNSNDRITFNGDATPELDDELAVSGASTALALRRKSNVLIGSTCPWGPAQNPNRRPVIKANAGYFEDERPIVQFWAQCRDGDDDCSPSGEAIQLNPGTTDPANGQSSVLFNNIFRNIDINSNVGPMDSEGKRNTGAIGIAFPGAQGSAIEDSTITMTDGNGNHSYIGVRNIPGQSGGIYNVTVHGGEYGLWMDRETRYGMAVGLRLYDQDTLAIRHTANNKLVIVGFHITRAATGPAVWIYTGGAVHPLPAFGNWSGIAMVDGVIENDGGAVMDVVNRPVYLKNVRIGSAGTANSNLVTTGTTLTLKKPTGAAWQQVDAWAYVSKTAASGVPYSLVDGTLAWNNTLGLVEEDDVDPSVSPGNADVVTATYVTPHLWSIDDLPSFEDENSIIVLAKRYDDNTVDPLLVPTTARPRVFLGGSGRHPIDSTVSIGSGRALAGLDRVHTVIETQWTSQRSTAAWCDEVPMITTSNSATSDAAFGRVSLAEFRDCTEFTPVEWRAGQASIMHAVMLTVSDSDEDPGFTAHPNQAGFLFSGNGGGKHWGLQPEPALIEYQTDNAGYRHLNIDATNKQLDIYGFNCEKVSGGTYACELDDAANVNLYNVKAETCHQCDGGGTGNPRKTSKSIFRLNLAQDVNVIGYGGNARPSEGQRALIVIDHASTSNLKLALINPNTSEDDPEKPPATDWFTVRRNISTPEEIPGPHIGGYVFE